MLKRYATFVSLFRSASDICIIGCIWLCVFYVRFHSGLFTTAKGIPDFKRHLVLTLPIVVICYLSCFLTGLYKPKRVQNIFGQFVGIFKAGIFSGLFVLAFFYYLQDVPYSRKLLALFVIMLFAGLVFSHLLTMLIIRNLRAKGYNLRYYAVIGAGRNGRQLVRDIERMGWLGLRCAFFVDNNPVCIGTEVLGAPVYGPVEKLTELVKTETIDEVYLSLSGNEAQKAYPVLKELQSAGVTIRIIPDWGNLVSISSATTITIGSQVLFSAADSPLHGANAILKEIFDRSVALILLVIFAVPMVLISVLIKLTGKGPIFFNQVRVGMDQKEFKMLKFRTMTVDAEEESEPQWTTRSDPRCTRIGAWLRRTSLDELPQLINVVKGQMSLIGPRPERPVLAKQFSEEYKKYMLRHKVKAGITGWAQINGFRGDTSLRKRLLYDLYYVRNWSWGLDMLILARTPWHVIRGENAY
ncbi:MAG: undecaprenyl-phosphate glucose phosphotransferase [Planctomycetota bacterium]|nr:MAG: undecaprenyl-phosphate glucose phosphotransferase [Planctomycetota bacterium]